MNPSDVERGGVARRRAALGTVRLVFLSWVILTLGAQLAFRARLINPDEWTWFSSAAEVHSLRPKIGADLFVATGIGVTWVVLRRLARPQPAPFWLDWLAILGGVALAAGLVLYPALVLGGWLPSFGLKPNGWPVATLYVFAVLALIQWALAVDKRRQQAL